jgi:ornithine cyclodeaminase
VRYLDAAATRNALSMADAITAMEAAFGDDRSTPPRVLVGSSLFMPGAVGSTAGIKVVSTVPGNPVGIVVVFDADGSPLGLIDGPTLTAIRTGAGAGLATRLLARPGASTLAILGAGAMGVGGIAVEHPDPAVAEADVVSTATPATEPLFSADAIRPGTHINAVGAFTPDMCEIPGELVRRAFVVVDDREAAALEAGDLLRVGRSPDATVADLLEGRMHPPDGDVTFFKSVGISSQDVAAGRAALLNAERLGLGTVID